MSSAAAAAAAAGAGIPRTIDPFAAASNLSIVNALRGKTLLLTGATGFLGKIILEKILRSAPDVGRIYVLVRPRKGSTADERMQSEIIQSEVFTRLKGQIGVQQFQELIRSKLVALPGELTLAEIGLTQPLLQELYPVLNFVIHSAAIVDFNERLDRAVELNVLGSLRLLEIAKRCERMEGFVHVSTAYVNSNRRGWIEEKLYPLGYDPEEMLARVREMKESELDKISGSGLLAEWPNTYTFTKAMTEHLIEKRRAHVPVIIVRPSIIGSSWREPVPGWVDCLTAAGAVYMACGLGILSLIPGQMDYVSDLIPADTVVNAILGALAVVQGQRNAFAVCHATSSTENTMHWGAIMDCVIDYFRLHPPARSLKKPSFQMVPSSQLFQVLFFLKYSIPSALLNTVTPIGSKAFQQKAALYNKLVWRARVIIESFRHFTDNQWSFHNGHTRRIGQMLVPEERTSFNLSIKELDWVDYNNNFCFGLCKYVLRMDLIEPEFDDPSEGRPRRVHLELNKAHYYRPSPQLAQIRRSAQGNEEFIDAQAAKYPPTGPCDMSFSPSLHEFSQRLFVDLHWEHRVLNAREKLSYGLLKRSKEEYTNLILNHPELQIIMKEIVDKNGVGLGRNGSGAGGEGTEGAAPAAAPKKGKTIKMSDLEVRAREMCEKMFGETQLGMISSVAYAFRKVWRKLYNSIQVEKAGLERLQELARNMPKQSLVYIPTHRSYIDFLIISYICFDAGLPIPFIAAGEDFLGILIVRYIFRHSGAFFIRRSFLDGANSVDGYLYMHIFQLYVRTLLCDGQSMEFYIEGTRSRSGKMLHPKTGMLQTITDMVLQKKTPNVAFVPISINYEKTIEGDLYSNELLGENKIKESFKNLLRSSTKFVTNNNKFGTISVVFQEPIDLQTYVAKYVKEELPKEQARVATMGPNAASAPVGPSFAQLMVKTNQTATTSAAASAASEDASQSVIPLAYRRHFNLTLAYHIIYQMQCGGEVMPTHLVSTLMLMYRQGITKQQLVTKVDWLRREVMRRGGNTNNFGTHDRSAVVTQAIAYLSHVIVQRRQELYEPAINSRAEYKNMLVLGHYRNKIVHLFFKEGVFACALYALAEKQEQARNSAASAVAAAAAAGEGASVPSARSAAAVAHVGVSRRALLSEARFLFNLLQREFITSAEIPDRINSDAVSEAVLAEMIGHGIFQVSEGAGPDGDALIEVAPTGETHFSFLCALLWPFIDSYYVAAMVLFSLQPSKKMEETALLQRTQWLATTLYYEGAMAFYESCSMDTLRNAFDVFQKWNIIGFSKFRPPQAAGPGLVPLPPQATKTSVQLLAPYTEEHALQQLISKINELRKPPPVKRTSMRRSLIADLPVLAKL